MLTRHHKYEDEGRIQNENEAAEVRKGLLNLLKDLNVSYKCCTSSEEDCNAIAKEIVKEIKGYEQ